MDKAQFHQISFDRVSKSFGSNLELSLHSCTSSGASKMPSQCIYTDRVIVPQTTQITSKQVNTTYSLLALNI